MTPPDDPPPPPSRRPFPDIVGIVTWMVALTAAGVMTWLFHVDLGKAQSASQQTTVATVSVARLLAVYVIARCVQEVRRALQTEP